MSLDGTKQPVDVIGDGLLTATPLGSIGRNRRGSIPRLISHGVDGPGITSCMRLGQRGTQRKHRDGGYSH